MAQIKLDVNLKPLLEDIQRANGNVEQAAAKAAEACADILEDCLDAACLEAAVSGGIRNAIEANVEKKSGGNVYACSVGWKMGSYNSRNPSTGYLAVFLDRGTAKRSVKEDHLRVPYGDGILTMSKNRGKIAPRGFVKKAEQKAKPKIKQELRVLLQEILEGLK